MTSPPPPERVEAERAEIQAAVDWIVGKRKPAGTPADVEQGRLLDRFVRKARQALAASEQTEGVGVRRWTLDYCPGLVCGWVRPADGDGPVYCPYCDQLAIRAEMQVVRDG